MPKQPRALTARMRDFCVHYAALDSGRDAAIAAGYSEKGAASRGSRLVANPLVQAEVERLRAQTSQSLATVTKGLEQDVERSIAGNEVLKGCLMLEMDAVIYHDPLDLWRAAGFSGVQLAALEALDPVDRRQVQGLKQTHTVRRYGKDEEVEETVLELKMRPRDPATMRMARHVGIGNTTKHEVAGPGGGPVQHEHKGLSRVTINQMLVGFLGIPQHMLGLPEPEEVPA